MRAANAISGLRVWDGKNRRRLELAKASTAYPVPASIALSDTRICEPTDFEMSSTIVPVMSVTPPPTTLSVTVAR